MKISIIIPAFNEEERIGESIKKIHAELSQKSYGYEIIVVDDGSSDNTINISKELDCKVLAQPKNMGKGAAVRRGMVESDGEVRLFSDADLSTPIYEIVKLLEKLNDGYDVAVGSRALKNELIREHQPWYREAMGKTFNKIVQFFVIKGIQDTQCGFKAFSAKSAQKIFSESKIDGFAFDVEALYLANRFGFKVAEVAVEWYNDDRSKVNPITDSIKMFSEILKIRKLHR